jgi:hypothetical protein
MANNIDPVEEPDGDLAQGHAEEWREDFEHVYKTVDESQDVRNSVLCELISQALEHQGHLPDQARQTYGDLVQPQAFAAIEAAALARIQSRAGRRRRQRMRARHERILGNVELPASLRWDPIIHALCSLLQQATHLSSNSPQVQALEVKVRDGDLSFRVSECDDYQRGLITMAEALSASWPSSGLTDTAEGDARYQALKQKHGRIIGRGLECDAGWVGLISVLCDELQNATDRMGAPQIETMQVKEKFGELRFYVRISSDYQRGLINLACAMSAKTCEICGAPGSMWVSGGYFHTACDEHRRPESITVQAYLYLRQMERDA